MTTLDHLAALLLERLAWTSLQAVALVGVVALLVRALPRLPAAARCALWWLVGLQVLLGLAWQTPIRLPLLAPPRAAAAPAAVAPLRLAAEAPEVGIVRASPGGAGIGLAATPAAASPAAAPAPAHARAARDGLTAHWRTILVALWLGLLLAQARSLIRQHRLARRLRRAAQPATDAGLQARCARQARALALPRTPTVLVSPDIASPQVGGGWRPVVLWPAHVALDAEESSLALAHELAHLKRGDLLLGWIPALAARLFFFHPLLRWAMHEYALHREAACDALALAQQRAAPQDYGRLLLQLGVAHPLHAGLAGASPTFRNLKRRLVMLQQTSTAMPRVRSWLLVALVALAGVLPYRVTAGATQPANAGTAVGAYLPSVPPAPPAPPPPPAPPAPGMLPPPAPPPPPPAPPAGFAAQHISISTHDDNGYGFALLDGDSVMVNGTDGDLSTVRRLRKRDEPLLWFRRGDKSWLIRDPAYIQRAKAAYAPIAALGKQQGKLGEQQGALGEQQGRLGGQQGEFGAREAELAMRQASLDSRMAELDSQADAAKASQATSDARKALQAQVARLDAQRQALRSHQAALGKQQQALSQQQEAFGKQQQALGERQRAASMQAEREIDKLLQEALAKGVAQPVSMAAPAPAAAPAPVAPARTHHDSDVDITASGSRYAHALYDHDGHGDTESVSGTDADAALAGRLHRADPSPMFWFRRGDQSWVIRDPAFVERARDAYAPVAAYWRDAGELEGRQWSLKGPLEGLQDRARSIETQRRELRADPPAPDTAPRLASLDEQQHDIDARTAALRKQLAALQPQLDARARQQRVVLAEADQRASQLLDEAIARGLAQDVGPR